MSEITEQDLESTYRVLRAFAAYAHALEDEAKADYWAKAELEIRYRGAPPILTEGAIVYICPMMPDIGSHVLTDCKRIVRNGKLVFI